MLDNELHLLSLTKTTRKETLSLLLDSRWYRHFKPRVAGSRLLQCGQGLPEKEATQRPTEPTDEEKQTPDNLMQTCIYGTMDFSVTEPIISLLSCLGLSDLGFC